MERKKLRRCLGEIDASSLKHKNAIINPMDTKRIVKIIGFGVLAFLTRFLVGGILFQGIKMNPLGFWFGFLITVTALIVAYVLLRFVMKPQSVKEAVFIAIVWVVIALFLDIVTAKPIVGVSVSFLLSQIQAWTRLLVIVLVAPFTVQKTK